MRILTIFARHGTAKYGAALKDLLSFQQLRLPSARHELVVVDNALDKESSNQLTDYQVIAGSNSFWEFSAWDEGLAHVGQQVWKYDFVHLVTSAFGTLYTRFVDRFAQSLLERVAGRAATVGHIDYYDEPVEIYGTRAQAWIRSSFLFIQPAELAALGSMVSTSNTTALFTGDPRHPFRRDAPLSENYRHYIMDWLTGPGTGQGVTWHSRFELTYDNFAYFERKVTAMLNEQLLAIRLRRQGCALVDVTWLATKATRIGNFEAVGEFPPWRVQLFERDTDAVPLPTRASHL